MSNTKKSIILLVLLAASFAAGRWLAPTKVVTVKEIVEIEKKDKKKEEEKHTTTTTTETVKPDGTKTTTTVVTEDIHTKEHEKETNISKNKESKEVVRDKPALNLALLVGSKVEFSQAPYIGQSVIGAYISKPILGPITAGLWGLSSGTVGVAIGLVF